MKILARGIFIIVGGALFTTAMAGCNSKPPTVVLPPAPAPAVQTAAPVEKPATAPPPQSPQKEPSVVIEPDRRARVPNPIYHPGTTNSLDLTGTYEGAAKVKFDGKLTLIVTKETSHGTPVYVMNSAIEINMPDGKSRQDKIEEVYKAQSNGKLKLQYKDSGSGKKWVDSTTCTGEPREYVEGSAEGCEVHFDDGTIEKSTSAVVKDGEYLKVTTITEKSGKDGKQDSSESYWFDPATGNIVRYSGLITDPDGSHMTITGS